MKRILLQLLTCLVALTVEADDRTISLAGEWQFALGDQMPLFLTETVTLPGTTDTNKKGTPLDHFDETTRLSRRYSYKGRAWYNREVVIPQSWKGETITLLLERTKYTQVYVDGKLVGHCNDISTPQRYNLSAVLSPGQHFLTIMVSNAEGVPQQIYASSHAYTEDTQTNWNGIIGRIQLLIGDAQPNKTGNAAQKSLTIQGHHFLQDGHLIFLRGRHDACVWPLTGHVPMDISSWRYYMKVCTDYGINHVRFHSWCPPEAAFKAADEAGIILQPELPFWGDFNASDSLLMTFLHKEGENILREYGHHPSFRMFALGNELRGSIEKMAEFIEDYRRMYPDKLYTFSSNYFLGYQGVKPGMDYFTTCRVGNEGWGNYNTHTRGSFSFADAADGGMINHFRPNASRNFEEGCQLSSVPVISHETAQFQTYPNYGEIGKYTGVLRPCNLEVFRKRLKDAGMDDQARDFYLASGRWSYLLYKQDIEMDLRTPSMAGFQLLDLQDYPGQGSAYVGILDAFLDSKGLCTPDEWRQFCAPVVPLLVCESYCLTNDKPFAAKLQVANYSGQSLAGQRLMVRLGTKMETFTLPDGEGLLDVGSLNFDLSNYAKATKLLLELKVMSTDYHNTYDLWVYPSTESLNKDGIIITPSITEEIGRRLEQGARVLLMPAADTLTTHIAPDPALTVGGLFQTDYWNYRMFKTISENNHKPVSPGTLGILCNPKHALFNDFPTEAHSNWQWWPVVKEGHPFMLDNTGKTYRPIVQVIDNVERNHKLGLVFEFQVGKGQLLVVMSDLEKASLYPEGRQFYASVLNYMHSKQFAPTTSVTLEQLRLLFSTKVSETKLEELNNITPY